jgi:RNA polymerase sigma-70 factor (ECF subfamily)
VAIQLVPTREWVRELQAGGEEQAAALGALRAYLVRAARYGLHRSRWRLGHNALDLDQLAEDCAQDALLAIIERLPEFRGDSRFTTWAYKFAINMALSAARRESRKSVSLDALLEATGGQVWLPEAEAFPGDPERTARRAEAWAAIHTVMDDDLSERQRRALKAVIVDQVPLDELARHWGATRNAIYKLVHDARRKLKTRLEARGFAPREMLALFSRPR